MSATTKDFKKFLKDNGWPVDTPRDMFLSFPLPDDNFKDAYEMLERGSLMYARLYCLDEFTVWNHVAGQLDKVKQKIHEGFIDKPTPMPIISMPTKPQSGSKGDKV